MSILHPLYSERVLPCVGLLSPSGSLWLYFLSLNQKMRSHSKYFIFISNLIFCTISKNIWIYLVSFMDSTGIMSLSNAYISVTAFCFPGNLWEEMYLFRLDFCSFQNSFLTPGLTEQTSTVTICNLSILESKIEKLCGNSRSLRGFGDAK